MRLYYESGRETPGKPFTGKKIAPPLTVPQAQAAYRAGQIDAENQAKTTAKAPETVAKESGKAYTVNRESEGGKAAAKNVDTSGANGYDALKNALNSSSRVTTADGLEYTITGLNELTYDMNTGGRSKRTVYRTQIRRTGGDKLGGSISNARDNVYSAGPFDTLEEAREDLLAVAQASGLVGKGATNGLGREQERLEPYMTEDEFYSLTNYGREIAVYWTTWLPKMCRRYETEHGKGSLYQRMKKLGKELTLQSMDLQDDGLNEDQADEIIREQFQYEPEPETMQEDEEEMSEEDKRYWKVLREIQRDRVLNGL